MSGSEMDGGGLPPAREHGSPTRERHSPMVLHHSNGLTYRRMASGVRTSPMLLEDAGDPGKAIAQELVREFTRLGWEVLPEGMAVSYQLIESLLVDDDHPTYPFLAWTLRAWVLPAYLPPPRPRPRPRPWAKRSSVDPRT